jgi:hypothetical protein
VRFTLVTDGSSDQVLVRVLSWLLGQRTAEPFDPQWADLRRLPRPPKGLSEKIHTSLHFYPCDLLFVHRDSEREPREHRVAEISEALSKIEHPPAVCVVPVRMQEAWLLLDEAALRRAAGCPRGEMPLRLPLLKRLEQEPNPKELLHNLLRQASGLSGRRAKQFRPDIQAHRLAELIDDYSPLYRLPAFRALDEELCQVLRRLGCRLLPASK